MAADDYDDVIREAALNWNIDPRLLKAVMLQESRGDPAAISKAGARGLMQIMPETGGTLGMTDLHDPTQSVWAGAKYLSQAMDAEKTPQDALRFYHGGPGWRQSYGPESRDYVPGVAKHYASLAPKEQPTAVSVATKQPDAGANAVTDDEFLKSTGATAAPVSRDAGKPQKAPDAPSDDDFLKATGAALAAPQAPETPQVPRGPSLADIITSPEAQAADRPAGFTPPSIPDIRNALQPDPNTQYADLPWTWVGRDKQTDATRYGVMPNALRAPLLELFGGGEGGPGMTTTMDPATGQMSSNLSPLAGLLMGGAARPLQFSGANPLARVPPGTFDTRAAVPGPITPERLNQAVINATPETWRPVGPAEEFQPGREYRMNQATGQREVKEGGPVGIGGATETPPAGREAVPGQQTQATGAQLTPTYEAIYTPAEEAAYRSTAEGQKLLEHQIIGEVDNNSYIPGVTVNQAELEQSVAAARDMKELGIQSKEATEAAKIAAQRNTEAREVYSLNTERTPVDIHTREMRREADIQQQSAEVFAPENVKGDVSMEPLIKQMREEMNVPRNRENSALQSEFSSLIKRLSNEDGTARTMTPEQAWGLRQDIDRMTDKHATTGTDPEARNRRRVAGNLSRVSDTLDGEIENMAPGYSDMVATYKAHSEAIREMEVLQGLTAKLKTGPQGTMSFAAMQRFMKNVVDARSTGAMDLNAYKAISPETMQRLWNLRDDLRRSAGALELARAAGSDTAQNILGILKSWGRLGVQGAAHAGAAHMFGPGGPIALRMLQEVTAPARVARTERRNVGRMQQMLNPSTPLRVPPGQENPLGAP